MIGGDAIEWKTEQRKLSDLAEFEKNPRQLSQHDAEHIRRSIEKFGLADPLVVNLDGQIIGGHQRKRIMLALEAYGPDAMIDVRIPSRALDEKEVEELNIRLNKNSGAWDYDILANEFDVDDLLNWGFKEFDLGIDSNIDPMEEWKGMPEFEQEDETAFQSIHIHFIDQNAIDEFAQLIVQKITPKTRSLWYPKIEIRKYADKSYLDES